jgi:hypothetical protein
MASFGTRPIKTPALTHTNSLLLYFVSAAIIGATKEGRGFFQQTIKFTWREEGKVFLSTMNFYSMVLKIPRERGR